MGTSSRKDKKQPRGKAWRRAGKLADTVGSLVECQACAAKFPLSRDRRLPRHNREGYLGRVGGLCPGSGRYIPLPLWGP